MQARQRERTPRRSQCAGTHVGLEQTETGDIAQSASLTSLPSKHASTRAAKEKSTSNEGVNWEGGFHLWIGKCSVSPLMISLF